MIYNIYDTFYVFYKGEQLSKTGFTRWFDDFEESKVMLI